MQLQYLHLFQKMTLQNQIQKVILKSRLKVAEHGLSLIHISRDIPANAYSGTYLDFRGMMYNKVFGSDNNFYRLEIDYRQYKTVGRRKVIAWTVQSKNAFEMCIRDSPKDRHRKQELRI